MEPLARIDYFDFDDPAFAAAHAVDGMHADRAVIDKPGHYYLSHWLHPFSVAKKAHAPRRLGCPLLLWFGSTWLLTRQTHEQGRAVTILESRCDHPVTAPEFAKLEKGSPVIYG